MLDRAGDQTFSAVVGLDGKPVPASARGASITVLDATTVVEVTGAELYRLIANGPAGDHTLTLTPTGPGWQGFAFTFGS